MAAQKIGRYEVERELGHGGMATVYLARDPMMKRQVAVKVLPHENLRDKHYQARFRREAEIVAQLEHPHIVPVHDLGEHKGQPFIVMRYMTGGSLSDRLHAGRLGLAETARIVSALAAALDYAHAKHIIHRDLKPANIMFDSEGRPYISDFGIAKLAEATTHLTGTGLMGTPMYMSPEQWRADTALDGRSDVYALGVMTFEMLSGRLPFEANTPAQIMYKHLMEPPPRILTLAPDLPPECNPILQKALAKEAEARYATAGEMAEALKGIVPAEPLPMPLPDAATAPQPEVQTPTLTPAPPREKPKTPPKQKTPKPAPPTPVKPPTPKPTPGDLRPTGMMVEAPKRNRLWIGLGVVVVSLTGIGLLSAGRSLLGGGLGPTATQATETAQVNDIELPGVTVTQARTPTLTPTLAGPSATPTTSELPASATPAVTSTITPRPSATNVRTAYVSAFNGGCNPPSVTARRIVFTMGFDSVSQEEAQAILAETPSLTANGVPAQLADRATTANLDPNNGIFYYSYETTFVMELDTGVYTISFGWNGKATGTCTLTVTNP